MSPAVRYNRDADQHQREDRAQGARSPEKTSSAESTQSKSNPSHQDTQQAAQGKYSTGSQNKTNAFEDAVSKYIGIPYKYGGNGIRGYDCSGLVHRVFKDFYGWNVPRTTRELQYFGSRIPLSIAQPGDLVFFSLRRFKIDHVGIYLGDGRFVHASLSRGVTIDSLGDDYYERNFKMARRLPTSQLSKQ